MISICRITLGRFVPPCANYCANRAVVFLPWYWVCKCKLHLQNTSSSVPSPSALPSGPASPGIHHRRRHFAKRSRIEGPTVFSTIQATYLPKHLLSHAGAEVKTLHLSSRLQSIHPMLTDNFISHMMLQIQAQWLQQFQTEIHSPQFFFTVMLLLKFERMTICNAPLVQVHCCSRRTAIQ